MPLSEGMIKPIDEVINEAIIDAIVKCNGNHTTAAKHLGIGRATLYRYLSKMRKQNGNLESRIRV